MKQPSDKVVTTKDVISELIEMYDTLPIKKQKPFKMKQPSKEQLAKMLTIVGVLPVIADLVEDCIDDKLIQFEMKKRFNELNKHIRRIDEQITKDMDLETSDQQIALQRAFRQWMNDAFKLDEE